MNSTINQPTTENMKKLRAAFSALRRSGFVARQRFADCSSCASSGLLALADSAEKKPRGIVYYHQQDHDHMFNDGLLMIRFFTVDEDAANEDIVHIANTVIECFRTHGLNATWNGDTEKCIEVDLRAISHE